MYIYMGSQRVETGRAAIFDKSPVDQIPAFQLPAPQQEKKK